MADHPNAAIVREAGRKLEESGDLSSQIDLIDDNVVWHEIGSDEPIRGKQALAERFAGMPEGATMSSKMHDVVANDDHCVLFAETTAGMGDQSLTYRTAEIYHMKDGKITERWAFSDDTDRINKFFGGQ